MDFRWTIASRTGEKHSGTDEFPTQDVKDSANTFNLILSSVCPIDAPYGQSIVADHIEVVVPDDSRLIFKRRVTMTMNGNLEECGKTYRYIIAFEKK